MNQDEMLKALAEIGVDVFTARRALDEVARRTHKANVRRLTAAFAADQWTIKNTDEHQLRVPTCLEVDADTFVFWRSATRQDLIAAANYTAERYLARRARRERLLDTFWAAAWFLPRLEGDQVVGDLVGVAS